MLFHLKTMIDIHSHYLHLVDDGSRSIEESLQMLSEAVSQGVSAVLLTPHYSEKFSLEQKVIEQRFEELKNAVKDANIPLELYLGQELYLDKNFKSVIEKKEFFSLAKSKYILVEFNSYNDTDIADVVYEVRKLGYQVIVAHFERYDYATIRDAISVKEAGGYIQVNADALFEKGYRAYKKKIKEYFNQGLVDFVASDIHPNRKNCMAKAYKWVKKKYGEETANAVFKENAEKIIKG